MCDISEKSEDERLARNITAVDPASESVADSSLRIRPLSSDSLPITCTPNTHGQVQFPVESQFQKISDDNTVEQEQSNCMQFSRLPTLAVEETVDDEYSESGWQLLSFETDTTVTMPQTSHERRFQDIEDGDTVEYSFDYRVDHRDDIGTGPETTRDVTEKQSVLSDGTVQKILCTTTKEFRGRRPSEMMVVQHDVDKDRILTSIDVDERITLILPNVSDISDPNVTSDEHIAYHEYRTEDGIPCRKKTTTITLKPERESVERESVVRTEPSESGQVSNVQHATEETLAVEVCDRETSLVADDMIESRCEEREEQQTLDDGGTVKRKITTTTFFKPVKQDLQLPADDSGAREVREGEEVVRMVIEERIIQLPNCMTDDPAKDIEMKTAVEQFEEVTSSGIPVMKTVITQCPVTMPDVPTKTTITEEHSQPVDEMVALEKDKLIVIAHPSYETEVSEKSATDAEVIEPGEPSVSNRVDNPGGEKLAREIAEKESVPDGGTVQKVQSSSVSTTNSNSVMPQTECTVITERAESVQVVNLPHEAEEMPMPEVGDQETFPVSDDLIQSRCEQHEEQQTLADGSTVKHKITTTAFFKPVKQDIQPPAEDRGAGVIKEGEEIVRMVIEEHIIQLPDGMRDDSARDIELKTTVEKYEEITSSGIPVTKTVFRKCPVTAADVLTTDVEVEISKEHLQPVVGVAALDKKITTVDNPGGQKIARQIPEKESVLEDGTETPLVADDVIQSRCEEREEQQTLDDGSTVKHKITTTTFFKPVKQDIQLPADDSSAREVREGEEIVRMVIEERIIQLPSGIRDDSSMDIEMKTTVEEFEKVTSSGVPITKSVIRKCPVTVPDVPITTVKVAVAEEHSQPVNEMMDLENDKPVVIPGLSMVSEVTFEKMTEGEVLEIVEPSVGSRVHNPGGEKLTREITEKESVLEEPDEEVERSLQNRVDNPGSQKIARQVAEKESVLEDCREAVSDERITLIRPNVSDIDDPNVSDERIEYCEGVTDSGVPCTKKITTVILNSSLSTGVNDPVITQGECAAKAERDNPGGEKLTREVTEKESVLEDDRETLSVADDSILSRCEEREEQQTLDDGGTVKRKITTTTFFKPVKQDLQPPAEDNSAGEVRDGEEIVRMVTEERIIQLPSDATVDSARDIEMKTTVEEFGEVTSSGIPVTKTVIRKCPVTVPDVPITTVKVAVAEEHSQLLTEMRDLENDKTVVTPSLSKVPEVTADNMTQGEVVEIVEPSVGSRVHNPHNPGGEKLTREITEKESVLEDGTVQKIQTTVTKCFRPAVASEVILGDQDLNKDQLLTRIDVNERITLIRPNVSGIDDLNVTSDERMEYCEGVTDRGVPYTKKITTVILSSSLSTAVNDPVIPQGECCSKTERDNPGGETTTQEVTEQESILEDGTLQKIHCTVTKYFRPTVAGKVTVGEQDLNEDGILTSVDVDERIMFIPANVSDVDDTTLCRDEQVQYHEGVTNGGVPYRKKTTTTNYYLPKMTDKDLPMTPRDEAVLHGVQHDEDAIRDAELLSEVSATTKPSLSVKISQKIRRIGSDGTIEEVYGTDDSLSYDSADHILRRDDGDADVVYYRLLSAADGGEVLPMHEVPADTGVQVFAKTVEGDPVVEQSVEEYEDMREDGSVVHRRVTKTTQKTTVVQQMLIHGDKSAVDDDATVSGQTIKEYTDVSFGSPEETQSNVEESEELLDDGTVVRRTVKTTSRQQLVTERHMVTGQAADVSDVEQPLPTEDSDILVAAANGKQSPQSYIPELMKLSGTESDSTKEPGDRSCSSISAIVTWFRVY